MTEQVQPGAADGAAEREKQKKVAQGAAFLPIGIVFLTIGATQLDDGNGLPFLVVGIAFLAMSLGWMSRAQAATGGSDARRERHGNQGDGSGTFVGDGGSGGHGRGGDGPDGTGHGGDGGGDGGGGDGGGAVA